MEKIGLEVLPRRDGARRRGRPRGARGDRPAGVVRPSFTLGGSGSAIAYNRDEFDDARPPRARSCRPCSEVLIEESIIGWKEYEMEVMRDVDDNVVIICSIENFDPMGVHTGDSITVAPAQTLTDKEYQRMRDAIARRHPRDRRRDRRLEHSVRHQSARRADDRHRDEPARQPLERAGVEGDRLSDRQDRRQAGRRLPAARAAERHHARNDGLLRADDRLRRHQDPAVRLREIPRSRRHADHADEERRRDDGHRPHVQGVVSEGAARAGSRRASASAATARTCGAPTEQPDDRRDPRQARRAQCRPRVVSALRAQGRHDASSRSTS